MKPSRLSSLAFTFAVLKRFSVIHPPLPLTPLQIEKLLGLIKESFRQQLAASAQGPSASKAVDLHNVSTPQDLHLNEVLQAPVFSASPEDIKRRQEDRIKRFLVDPISVFEEHVALGTANLHLASSCLKRYQSIRKQDGSGFEGDASGRVLEGLRRVGLVKEGTFLKDSRFMASFLRTRKLEGKDHLAVPFEWVAWGDLGPDAIQETVKSAVAAVEKVYSHEAAVKVFLNFVGKLLEKKDTIHSASAVQMTGIHLCNMGRKDKKLDDPAYQQLLQVSVYWAAKDIHPLIQLRFRGDTNPAVRYFVELDDKNMTFWEQRGEAWLRKNALIGLEVASQCLKQGKTQDAHRIVFILKRRFAGKVRGLDVESITEQQDTEVVSPGFLGQLLELKERLRTKNNHHQNYFAGSRAGVADELWIF